MTIRQSISLTAKSDGEKLASDWSDAIQSATKRVMARCDELVNCTDQPGSNYAAVLFIRNEGSSFTCS